MKSKIIAIVGPTSSGKSVLAVRLAQKFNGEIISADSRQVYKGLDIGSGKLEVEKRKGIKHHLLDVASPKRTFTVVRYKKLAERAIQNIIRRGKLPILAGGTGFYLDAVLGQVVIPPVPPNVKLRRQLEKLNDRRLFQKLKKLDPGRAKNIDRRNRRRLIRAIEISLAEIKGSPPPQAEDYPLEFLKIGILIDKEKLRRKIQTRLRQRLRGGLIAEVKKLHRDGLSWQRLDDLGLDYRYASRYLRSQITVREMVRRLETEIWHYAKRQTTWFKRDQDIHWIKRHREAERLVRRFLKVRPFSVKVEP